MFSLICIYVLAIKCIGQQALDAEIGFLVWTDWTVLIVCIVPPTKIIATVTQVLLLFEAEAWRQRNIDLGRSLLFILHV